MLHYVCLDCAEPRDELRCPDCARAYPDAVHGGAVARESTREYIQAASERIRDRNRADLEERALTRAEKRATINATDGKLPRGKPAPVAGSDGEWGIRIVGDHAPGDQVLKVDSRGRVTKVTLRERTLDGGPKYGWVWRVENPW